MLKSFPCFAVLPMGLSWVLYLAQECLRHCIQQALGSPQFLVGGVPSPSVVDQPCVVEHIDNGVHAGCNRNQVRSDKKKVAIYLNSIGLTTHDETSDALITTALGFVIDGDRLELRPKPDRVDRVCQALVPLIRGVAVARRDMEQMRGVLFLSC